MPPSNKRPPPLHRLRTRVNMVDAIVATVERSFLYRIEKPKRVN